jgi:peptidoglycan/LPS O-acetylase OafA/YrhL
LAGAAASSDREPSGRRRIDDIEVLRAFAVGLVLVEHARINLIPWVGGVHEPLYRHFGFWSGVDLFFAISGFVIARSLLPTLPPARRTGDYFNASLAFWVRRAWRLLPSAWLWLAVILVCAAVFNRSGAFQPMRANIEGAAAAVLNLQNFRTAHIFMKAPLGAAFPYWSLSLEEQFYLVLPFLIFLARRRLPLVLVVIVAAQFFIRRHGAFSNVLMNMTKSDAISLGVLLAIWSSRPSYARFEPRALRPWPIRAVLPPLLLVIFSWLSSDAYGTPNFQVGLIAVLSAAFVWLASFDGDYIFPPGRLKRLLCWMGARSYAIYLIHIPAFFATREFWFRLRPEVLNPGPGHLEVLLATGLPLLFVLAELNYRFVERPLRRYGAGVAERMRDRGRRAATSGAPGFAKPAGLPEDSQAAR